MKTLYFDCFSGISGDMVIGALIDAGADPNHLVKELKKLKLEDEYELRWTKVIKNGITSTKFDVVLTNEDHTHIHSHSHSHDHDHHHDHTHEHSQTHDHNHDHEHTHSHDHDHEHTHIHDHSHDHEQSHTHEHIHDHSHDHEHIHTHDHHHGHGHSHTHDHHHHHDHRAYSEIVHLIKNAGFSEQVETLALKIFKKIGEAEGLIHGIPLEKVHFHEVGAIDSIIDIVGAAILLEQLGNPAVKASSVPVGFGKIHIDHGIYPVPAPATLEILKGVPLEQTTIRGELTTPTGAAIVAVLAEEFCTLPSMRVEAIGYGAGTKTFSTHPNVLRVIIGQ
jgi:pyridinium-3,5-bisthiocarboxylic acid mononucleotide nickel chelatase